MFLKRVFTTGSMILVSMMAMTVRAQAPAPAGSDAGTSASAESKVVIMKVNGEEVTQGALDDMAQMMIQRQMQMMSSNPNQLTPESFKEMEQSARKEAPEQLIKKTIFDQAVQASMPAITDEAVTAKINEYRAAMKKDGVDLDAQLKENNVSLDDAKKQVKMQLAMMDMVAKHSKPLEPTNEDIQKFYDEQKKSENDALRTRHILIGYPGDARDPNRKPPTDAEKAELRKKAEAALARVKGGEDFAKVAEELSTCPSAKKGGDLDYNPKGQMVPAYDEAAWKLKKGEISDVVETDFGFHVIKSEGLRSELPMDDVKDEIKNNLTRQNMSKNMPAVLEKLQAEAKVEKTPEFEKIMAANDQSTTGTAPATEDKKVEDKKADGKKSEDKK